MPTLAELCDAVAQIAENITGRKIKIDEPTVELLFPVVLQKVLLDAKLDAGKIKSLIKTHQITIANGSADLPSAVMPEYFDHAEMYDEDGEVSYISNFTDFMRGGYSALNYFTIKNNKIHYKNNTGDDQNTSATLYAVTLPALPVNQNTQLDISADLLDEIKIEMVRAIRGEPPYSTLGEEEKNI